MHNGCERLLACLRSTHRVRRHALQSEGKITLIFSYFVEFKVYFHPYYIMTLGLLKSLDNSTAMGVTNINIVPHRAKMMDMKFWWLHCHASQDQFCYYWDVVSNNWADYHTKHHPDTYHEAH